MSGQEENDDIDSRDPNGPTDADIARYGSEDYERNASVGGGAITLVWRIGAVVAFIALALSLFLNVLLPALSNRSSSSEPERVQATVMSVIDARTITVDIDGDQRTVRYIGVRTPVTGEPYYELAISANEQWTVGQTALLEADDDETDIEGRLLRYVWIDGVMVNNYLIAAGLARVGEPGRNDRYLEVFQRAELNARNAGIGIWDDEAQSASAAGLALEA